MSNTNEANAQHNEDNIVALTRNQEFTVSFKLPKGTSKDEKGNPIDELGNPVIKRPTFKIQLPVPTVEGLLKGMKEDEKVREFVLDIIAVELYKAARIQTDDEVKPANSTEELDFSKITLGFLANQPPAERRGGGIAKELWEEFGKDYLAIMPEVTGKAIENVSNAVTLFLKKLQPVKTNKKVLGYLKEQLALYATHTERLEEFADCYEFLDNKITEFLSKDEADLLNNL